MKDHEIGPGKSRKYNKSININFSINTACPKIFRIWVEKNTTLNIKNIKIWGYFKVPSGTSMYLNIP